MDNTIDPANFNEQQIQDLMDAGVSIDKIKALQASAKEHRAAADEARNSLQGRYSGGTFIANNPLEFLAAGLRTHKEEGQADQADKDVSGLQQSVANARKMYYDVGVLGRNQDPGQAAAGMDAQQRISADQLYPGSPDLSAALGAPPLQMMAAQVQALRKKKQAAMPPLDHPHTPTPPFDPRGEEDDPYQEASTGSVSGHW